MGHFSRGAVSIAILSILIMTSLSGCLSTTQKNDIFTYENEIVFLRVGGGSVFALDSNSTWEKRSIGSDEVLDSGTIEGLIFDQDVEMCSFNGDYPLLQDTMCFMVNGDFGNRGSLNSDSLYLNICYVSNYSYDKMQIHKCEFYDISIQVGGVSDIGGEVVRYSQSEYVYAITYPTEAGTYRVYSNNSVYNLDTGESYLVPIPVRCEDIWGYNCNHWPSNQTGIQTDAHIWEWYSPIFMPYPAENGTRFYVTYCSNRPSNTFYAKVTGYDIVDNYDAESPVWNQVYLTDSEVKWCGQNIPIFVNSWRYEQMNFNENFSSFGENNGPDRFFSFRDSSYLWSELDTQTHFFIPRMYWWRPYFSCESGFEVNVNYNSCGSYIDSSAYYDNSLSPYDYGRIGTEHHNETEFYNSNGIEDEGKTCMDTFESIILVTPNDFSLGHEVEINSELVFFSANGNQIEFYPNNVTYGNYPQFSNYVTDQSCVGNLNSNPSTYQEFISLDDPIFIFSGILTIPALLLIFSSRFNIVVSNKVNSVNFIGQGKSNIERLYFRNWLVKSRKSSNFSMPTVELAGKGFISIVEFTLVSLAYIILGGIYASLYLMYLGLIASLYIIAAYLIISGIVLLITVGSVGLICFLPILLFMAIFG